jgi:hypothetical protein
MPKHSNLSSSIVSESSKHSPNSKCREETWWSFCAVQKTVQWYESSGLMQCRECIVSVTQESVAAFMNQTHMYLHLSTTISCIRSWRPIGLWDAEVPTFSRRSAHWWRWGCQPYAPPVALYPQEDSWYSFLLEAESSWLRHYATSRKVAGSIPDEVTGFLQFS